MGYAVPARRQAVKVRPSASTRVAGASALGGWLICSLLLIVALLFRAYLLRTAYDHIDSDQAVVGLMAFHIQHGDRPVFYYGQPYQGSLEAYAAALAFAVFGASDWTLRLCPLAFSVLFVGLVCLLGTLLYGRRVAVLSALFVALGPSLLICWSTVAGGYIEAMVSGTLLLLLAILYPDLRAMPPAVALLAGLLAGFGIWMQPISVEYLLPAALAWALPLLYRWRPRTLNALGRLLRALVLLLTGTVAGAAPLVLYNLRHQWATLVYLRQQGPGGDHLLVAEHLITQSLPVLLGFLIPTTVPDRFAAQTASHPLAYWAAVVLGAIVVLRLIADPRGIVPRIALLATPRAAGARSAASEYTEGDAGSPPYAGRDGVLALFALCCPLFFVFSSFGATHWSTMLPRYLIPIYTITPLVMDIFVPRQAGRVAGWIASAATGIILAAGVVTTLSIVPRQSIGPLIRLLDGHGARVVYTDYWMANRVAFETHERIVGIPVTPWLATGQIRVPSYLDTAAHTPASHIAWMLDAGSPAEGAFRRILRRTHTRAVRYVWREIEDGYIVKDHAVYTNLSRPLPAPLR